MNRTTPHLNDLVRVLGRIIAREQTIQQLREVLAQLEPLDLCELEQFRVNYAMAMSLDGEVDTDRLTDQTYSLGCQQDVEFLAAELQRFDEWKARNARSESVVVIEPEHLPTIAELAGGVS